MTWDLLLAIIGLALWVATLAIYVVGYIRAGRELRRLRRDAD